RLQLSNPKLGFKPIDTGGGSCEIKSNSEACTLELRSDSTTLKVPVEAKTAGVFKLAISLSSPDGDLALSRGAYTVRSTAASGVGIILWMGAALLLIMWWIRDLRHGRRARRLVPPPSAPEQPVADDEPVGDGWPVGDEEPAPVREPVTVPPSDPLQDR